MGGAKRMMEEHEEQRGVAVKIAIDAGVLEECEYHEGSIFTGNGEIESAFKLGSSRLAKGQLGDLFENQRQMTDTIKEVVDEYAGEKCQQCAKNHED